MIDNNLCSHNLQPIWLGQTLNLLKTELSLLVNTRRQVLEILSFQGDKQLIIEDPERLFQAFHNILIYAIRYTPDGGKINVDGRTLPGFIEITFTDNGMGISPEDNSIFFEKFGQLGETAQHSSGKTKFKGGEPGLGLPIARGIIKAHSGTVWVESEGCDEKRCPGRTFHILLPARTEPSDPKLEILFGIEVKGNIPSSVFSNEYKE